MKKRFMLVAVLLGSLALASCVDDKESDSVTALRNAVVDKIKANTAYTNAQAAYEQAKVLYQQAQTESALEDLRQKKIQNDLLLATNNVTIVGNVNAAIENASNNYVAAVAQLVTDQGAYIQAKMNLAGADLSYAAALAAYQAAIVDANAQIETNTAIIERLKALDAAGLDKNAIYNEMNGLAQRAYQLAKTDYVQAQSEADVAKENAQEAYAKMAPTSDYLPDGIDPSTLTPPASPTPLTDHEQKAYEDNLLSYVEAAQYLQELAEEVNRTLAASLQKNFFTIEEQEAVEIDECPIASNPVNLYEPTAASETAQAKLNATNYLNAQVEDKQNTLGKPATDTDPASGKYADLATFEEDLKTAKEALEAADPENAAAVAAAEQNVAEKEIAVLAAKEAVATAAEELADVKEKLAAFEAALAVVQEGSDAQKEYVAAIAAWQELVKEQLLADHKLHELKAELEEILGTDNPDEIEWNADTKLPETVNNLPIETTCLYGALEAVYNDVADVQTLIANSEGIIAAQQLIVLNGDANNPKPDAEVIKATLQAAVDAAATKVALQEQIVAKLKALLESLLATEA